MLDREKHLDKAIDRRQFIRKSAISLLGAGTLLASSKISISSSPQKLQDFSLQLPDRKPTIPAYNDKALFFNEHQYALVATLAALIMPTDKDPGATEAGVVDYIDKIVADSKKKQDIYTKGLKWLDDFSQEKFGTAKDFLNLSLGRQIDMLGLIYAKFAPRRASSLVQRVSRKLTSIWDGLFGDRIHTAFCRTIRQDVLDGYYSNPIAWKGVGYFGPPNPVGYPDFADPPSPKYYTGSIRLVDNASCNTCHEEGEHPRGGLINHTCISCHRPHAPWPYDKEAFHLEDHVGVLFTNPDREKRKH